MKQYHEIDSEVKKCEERLNSVLRMMKEKNVIQSLPSPERLPTRQPGLAITPSKSVVDMMKKLLISTIPNVKQRKAASRIRPQRNRVPNKYNSTLRYLVGTYRSVSLYLVVILNPLHLGIQASFDNRSVLLRSPSNGRNTITDLIELNFIYFETP
ncbi:hypothetical protein BC833DRAFT_566584 [Globomyces pollinis-pini]|nr:hypothetical protein BC833DRAFT_566584 [Globomyces pollinis-pini]